MKRNLLAAIVITLVIIPCIYLAVVYKALPNTVATHFGLDGKPDGFSNKATFIFIMAFMSIVNGGTYLLLSNLYRIDPKKSAKLSKDTMQKIGLAIVVLIAALSIIIIHSAVDSTLDIRSSILPLLGIFFAYLGNMMYSVKPNYFVGIRTPWALEDEETWRKTHQLAGKLWFGGGIVIALGGFLLPLDKSIYFLVVITLIISLIPAVFSYRYYQNHKKS